MKAFSKRIMKKGRKLKLNIALIGRSGSGKGTQAKLLMKKFGLKEITTGALFRELAKQNTETGREVKKILAIGGLPPAWLAEYLWVKKIVEKTKPTDGLVFDGSPRRVSEAQLLDKILPWYGRTRFKLILIDISQKEAFDRLTKRRTCKSCGRLIPWVGEFKKLKVCDKCGGKLYYRKDDNPKAIKGRMEFYKKSVVPTIKYYIKRKRLIRINGEQSIEKVFEDILKAIEND